MKTPQINYWKYIIPLEERQPKINKYDELLYKLKKSDGVKIKMEKRYLIYIVTGGLNHMLNQINNAVHLSIVTNRFLIILCDNYAFKNDFNKYFYIPQFDYATSYECFRNDDKIYNKIEIYVNSKISASGGIYFLKDKKLTCRYEEIVNNKDDIVYFSYLLGKQYTDWKIKVNQNIAKKIIENKIDDKYIGIHYRNTDMKHSLESLVPKINILYSQTKNLYLGTDDYTAYNRLNIMLEKKFNIIQYTKPFNNNGKNIHYGNPDKDEVIMNALTDMYHLIRATYFIASEKSSFSKRILELRKNDIFFK